MISINNNNNNNSYNNNNNLSMTTTSVMQQVSVSFLNVKNLRSNFIYTEELANEFDILYLNELWCSDSDLHLIRTVVNYKTSYPVIQLSS